MGWVNEDDPGHEGYAVGLVEEAVTYSGDEPGGSTYLRELSYYQPGDREIPQTGLRPAAIQVACECGWRSRRFHAPLGARYFHHYLELGDAKAEEEALQLWKQHCRDEAQARAAGDKAWLFPYRGGN